MAAFIAALNGSPITEATITLPRVGVWRADVTTTAAVVPPPGPAVLNLGGQSMVGAFQRVGLGLDGNLTARVVGGAGGLAVTVQPKSYRGVPLRIPLTDVLLTGKERLSPTADPAVTGWTLTAWSTPRTSASGALTALLQAVSGATWRVLLDGTIWVGFEAWAPAIVPDAVVTDSEPDQGRLTIASINPAVLPGQTYAGQRVGRVEHRLADKMLRTTLFFGT